MTDIDLNAIKARAEAATEGPWYEDDDGGVGTRESYTDPEFRGVVNTEGCGMGNPADAEFIAHARTDVPALVAEVERLRRIEAILADVRDGTGWTVQIGGVLIQQCDTYGQTSDYRRAKRAEGEVERVRALHAHEDDLDLDSPWGDWCAEGVCSECCVEWPCPTIRALDGDA